MITLPSPSEYTEWQSWGAMVVAALSNTQAKVINLPLWVWNPAKPRNGLPPAEDGDLIRILKDGVYYLGVANGNAEWILFSPTSKS